MRATKTFAWLAYHTIDKLVGGFAWLCYLPACLLANIYEWARDHK